MHTMWLASKSHFDDVVGEQEDVASDRSFDLIRPEDTTQQHSDPGPAPERKVSSALSGPIPAAGDGCQGSCLVCKRHHKPL